MWNSLNNILLKNKHPQVNEKDIKFFINNYFYRNFKGVLDDYDVLLKNKNIIIKIHAQNPLVFKEIINKKQEIKESIENKLKTKFFSLEIKIF
jgi:hypothetical protein